MQTGMREKYDKKLTSEQVLENRSLRENVSVFWIAPSALISRNVGTKGHLRKEIVLLKYKFFRFRPKCGGQVELIDWRKTQGF